MGVNLLCEVLIKVNEPHFQHLLFLCGEVTVFFNAHQNCASNFASPCWKARSESHFPFVLRTDEKYPIAMG